MINPKLGNASEVIAKVVKILLFIELIIVLLISYSSSKTEFGLLEFIAFLISILIIYIVIRFLFKPIIELYSNIKITENKNTPLASWVFREKWVSSLIRTIISCIVFLIPTFGTIPLLMIPHFILLAKSKKLGIKKMTQNNTFD
jgi:hypothetical protein